MLEVEQNGVEIIVWILLWETVQYYTFYFIMIILICSFFLEKNMLLFFLKILNQNPGTYVCVQVLQTLNILFENIRHETSLCKLLQYEMNSAGKAIVFMWNASWWIMIDFFYFNP